MNSNIKIGFIGAGQVNFGGGEGPWDHASRLEKIENVEFCGIAEPDEQRAIYNLDKRKKGNAPQKWEHTKIYKDYLIMLKESKPTAVFIGLPPSFHGSIKSPNDVELECARFGVHMFIEKPLSCFDIQDVQQLDHLLVTETKEKNLILSVGYMFRYSKAILKMKELIGVHGPPKLINARYDCAYSTISKEFWWDQNKSGGPIIEQMTHFCDLARFFAGEVDLSTIKAQSIQFNDEAGKLNNMSCNENNIPEDRRISRVTTSIWRFKSGALASFTHGALLHGIKYETEFEIWGDGYRLILRDPYGKVELSVRTPASEKEEVYEFSQDDPYLTENRVFIDAIQSRNTSKIQSPYSDAFKTYELSWAIRQASKH